MTNFDELFKKYDPTTASVSIVTEEYAKGFHDGAENAYKRLLRAVEGMDVDSFDDIVYKKDLFAAIDALKKPTDD